MQGSARESGGPNSRISARRHRLPSQEHQRRCRNRSEQGQQQSASIHRSIRGAGASDKIQGANEAHSSGAAFMKLGTGIAVLTLLSMPAVAQDDTKGRAKLVEIVAFAKLGAERALTPWTML
jgi:hypothetical protein